MYYSYGEGSLINSEKIFTIFDWTTSIAITLITPIVIIGMINKKVKKIVLIETILMIMLYVFSTSGRLPLFIAIIELVIALLINKEKLTKKFKKVSKLIFISVLILILGITNIRTDNTNTNKVNSMYAYLSIPLPYFSKLVNFVDNEDINTYGLATCYGPYLLVQKSIKIITGYKLSNAEELNAIVTKPQNYWVRVFGYSTDYYNAYSTMFYNFYLDFREVGVIIISFLYGMFMEKIYMDIKYKRTMKSNTIYLILISGLIKSFISWQFASPTIIMVFILINILFRKGKIEKNDKSTGIWND